MGKSRIGLDDPAAVSFNERRLNGFDHSCIFLAKSNKRAVASLLMDRQEIDASVARMIAKPGAYRDYCGVYVMGPTGNYDVSKIGISANPIKRLSQMQTALWSDVLLHALIWAPLNIAVSIEAKALRLAKAEKLRLRGEWVALPADEAVGLILTAMDGTEMFTDPGTFNNQWAPPIEVNCATGGRYADALADQYREDAWREGRELTHSDFNKWFMKPN